MIRTCFAVAILAAFSAPAFADAGDQAVLDQCIAYWGNAAPFKKGTPAEGILSPGVRVFGLGGGAAGNDPVTEKARLVLVRPAVNVMGRTTIQLNNPHGWYCFRSNVTVAGKIQINAHCHAHIAAATDSGTAVGAADDTSRGVAVFGALRVTRFGCPPAKK